MWATVLFVYIPFNALTVFVDMVTGSERENSTNSLSMSASQFIPRRARMSKPDRNGCLKLVFAEVGDDVDGYMFVRTTKKRDHFHVVRMHVRRTLTADEL